MKKIIGTVLVLAGLVFSSATVLAENVDWQNKQYDFKKIHKVYIEPEVVINKEAQPGFVDFSSIVLENSKNLKKYQIVQNKEEADAIIKVTVLTWGIKERTIPTHDSITHDKVVHYKDKKTGKEKYTITPRKETTYEYTSRTFYFSSAYEVTDKNGVLLYEHAEERSSGNKAGEDMFFRATQSFFKRFNRTAK